MSIFGLGTADSLALIFALPVLVIAKGLGLYLEQVVSRHMERKLGRGEP